MKRKLALVKSSTSTPAKFGAKGLLADVREMILSAREGVARTVDATLALHYWEVGRRIREDILKRNRAEDAARFLRLRLATHFLQTQIERFRKENQGPLLEKSGRVFQSITRGAFSGLGAEFSADDVPVLVGLRPDQTPVSIEAMSDGTRDQLYLALRLAALDRYLEAHEPMPLILDDLLITFDNERTKAILPQLAGLAKRTQIFLFTHHEHLVELCRQTLGEQGFQLHRLDAGTPRSLN